MPSDQFPRLLRRRQTDAERRLWFHLRASRLEGLKFRRQHQIGPYTVDFCCIDRCLIVELDGGQHAERQRYDRERTEFLQSEGWRVLRFWDNQALTDTDGVLEVIREALIDERK